MIDWLKLVGLFIQLAAVAGIARQVWHPNRSQRWVLGWLALLGSGFCQVARQVALLRSAEPVAEVLLELGVSTGFLVGVWQLTRLFEDDLLPLPPVAYGHIRIDTTSTILEWDAAATRIFGFGAQEVIGQSLLDTIIPAHSREAHRHGMERYLAEPRTGWVIGQWTPVTACHQDGRLFTVEVFIEPQTWPDGTLTFLGQVRQVITL